MNTTRKVFDLAVLTYGVFSISILLPILGGFFAAGFDILNVPSWVFGSGGSFLLASAICFPLCNEESTRELKQAAPALLALALLVLPVYLVVGLAGESHQSSAINLAGMSKTLGQICIGFSVFFVPLVLWAVSLAALVNTLKPKAGGSHP